VARPGPHGPLGLLDPRGPLGARGPGPAAHRGGRVPVEDHRVVWLADQDLRARLRARLGEDSFLIRGEKPKRWVQQTDFSNDEAIGYLADRLARLGVEEALAEAGAEPGAEVLIGEPDDAVVFDWDPAAPMSSGASGARSRGSAMRRGPRGTDPRLSP